ncbi:phage tail tape measure protein [Streptobacillus canis]|uniref:hypothetical protein n=1 Tax=Streptobacillus canis TaxID=2678686 RepID=UPI0012E25312|nr:hypothetical protein [Streptobacillus canis]
MAIKIGAIFELKDQFSKRMKTIEKITGKSFKNISKNFKKLKNRAKKTFKLIGGYIVKGVIVSVAALGKYMKDSLKSYEVQNRATLTLTNSLKKQQGMTNQMIKSTLDYAGVVQSQGVIGDEVLQMGMNELALYGLKGEQIKKLTSGLGDMLVKEKGLNATVEDSMMAGKAIVKALSGKVKGLQSYGITLDETEQKTFKLLNTEKKIEFLNNKIKTSIGDLNKKIRETPEGVTKALANEFGDVQEVIGESLQPVVTNIMKELLKNIPTIKKYLMDLIKKIKEIEPVITSSINVAISFTIKLIDSLIVLIKWLSDNWSWIKKLAVTLSGLIVILKIYNKTKQMIIFSQQVLNNAKALGIIAENTTYASILKSIGAFLWQKTVMIGSTLITWGMTAATWALNTALAILTSPIALVIGAVVGLATGTYYLYKNFDWVKSKIGELWTAFKNSGPIQTLIGWFKSLLSYIQPVLDIIIKLKDGITGLITGGIDKIKGLFGFGKGVEIPKNAMGTPYFQGGPTMVNERGGELINLPNGSQIIPHDLSKKIVNNKTSNANITININGSDKSSKEIAYEVAAIFNRQLGLQGGNVLG